MGFLNKNFVTKVESIQKPKNEIDTGMMFRLSFKILPTKQRKCLSEVMLLHISSPKSFCANAIVQILHIKVNSLISDALCSDSENEYPLFYTLE